MFKVVKWSEDLDLTEFYAKAAAKGLVNNSSQKAMIDCFRNEREWAAWIIYWNDIAVGSVAAHSLDIVPGYRICARTCSLDNQGPMTALRTLRQIREHQHITTQVFIPVCVEWAGADKDLYITSHPSDVGSQRGIHNICMPNMEDVGSVTKEFELDYRGHVQTFWKLNVDEFFRQLNSKPRWPYKVVKTPHLN